MIDMEKLDKPADTLMHFWIQTSNPRITGAHDPEASSLAEAIESAFPLETEGAILFWNSYAIPLGYKYDLSILMEDVLTMVSALTEKEQGTLKICWPDNGFRSDWTLDWLGDQLQIAAEWETARGPAATLLNQLPPLQMDRRDLVREWKGVMGTVLNALDASGYDEARIPDLSLLRSLHRKIDRYGILYESPLASGF